MRSKKTVLLLTFIMIMALLSSGCLFNIRPVIESILDQIGKVGQEFTYQVIAYDPNNGELTYFLTGKPERMQIGSSGLITWTPGESQIGTFTVEVKVSNVNSFRVKQFEITIEETFLTSITVLPSAISVYVGNSNTVTSVTAHYDNGDSTDLALADCDYSSSNTGIATGSGSGVITGVSAGTAVITVTYTEGGITKTDTASVTVEDISLTSIEASPANINVYIGNSNAITSITAFYNDGSNTSIALSWATYQSSNTNIATVNNNGLITGVSPGTAVITVIYTEGGITKADMVGVTISETPKVLTSIEVSPSNINIYVGNSKTITLITADYSNGDSTDLDLTECDYSSDNPNIATVSGSGVITGVSAGTATIIVSYTEGGITKTDTVSVTISQAPKVLTSIIVLPSTMSIRKGQSQTIASITAYYNDASSANIELSACSYQSSVANVTVTNGVITVSSTCAATSAIITVSYTEGGVTESDNVNVTITGG